MTDPKKTPKKRSSKVLWILLLLLLLLFLMQWKLGQMKEQAIEEQRIADSLKALVLRQADSLQQWEAQRLDRLRTDSIRSADSLRRIADSLALRKGRSAGEFAAMWKVRQDSLRHVQDSLRYIQDSLDHIQDSLLLLRAKQLEDSMRVADSLRRQDSIAQALRATDQDPAHGLILPPAGRYYKPLSVRVACNEPKCLVQAGVGDTSQAKGFQEPIPLKESARVWWRVTDSVGNVGPWNIAYYDIASTHGCGENSFPVPVRGKQVCVDAYEYPNIPEELPRDMVSHEEAVNLCAKAGKRLCSLEEWQSACHGKDKTRFPYGSRYEQSYCATAQKKVERMGRKEACRSWWGMQDMSGNLWEWTATPNPQRPSFYFVAGGSWNTSDESSCSTTKFSFYPQNQYPFVGFRCCADAAP